MAINTRTHAANVLTDWQRQLNKRTPIYAQTLIARTSRKQKLSQSDHNLLHTLVVGTIRHRRLLDHLVDTMRQGELDDNTRNALRIGILQILIIQLPEHAAVHATVESVRKGARGLVNAILRRTIREKKALEATISKLPLAIRHSHPDWIVDSFTQAHGATATADIVAINQLPTNTTFRINPLKSEQNATIAATAEPLEGHAGYYRSRGLPPQDWLDRGLIYITDPATQHSVDILAPQPGESILDACAAPGGKSALIAAQINNEGTLLATDSNPKRLPRMEENFAHQGITCAATACHDWTTIPPSDWHERFDAILLDVPCSNTGVLRKRIDARWRISPETITQLLPVQAAILHEAQKCLTSGGRIVYSTCSIEPAENQLQIAQFLQKHSHFALNHEQLTLPSHSHDGSYAALLTKK